MPRAASICKECHWSQCNERHQFVGGGTFARSPAWRRLCSAARASPGPSAVPLWLWTVTGSKGADEEVKGAADTTRQPRGSPGGQPHQKWASLEAQVQREAQSLSKQFVRPHTQVSAYMRQKTDC